MQAMQASDGEAACAAAAPADAHVAELLSELGDEDGEEDCKSEAEQDLKPRCLQSEAHQLLSAAVFQLYLVYGWING